jgi:hypothetical protein
VSDSTRTNNITILEYDIEAIDSDIELDTLAVNIQTGTATYNNVIQEVRLVIDGKIFRSKSISTTGAYSPTSVLAQFDIDNKIMIDADDSITVAVVVDLKSTSLYSNGETISAKVTSAERDITEAEGSDDVTEFSGTAVGNIHTLISEGVSVNTDNVKFTTSTLGQNSTIGSFTIEFKVTGVDGDFYIKNNASTTADTTNGGIQFSVDGNPTLDTVSGVLSSTAREVGSGVYVVREGRTETFTLSVTLDPTTIGQYRVGLDHIMFTANTDGITGAQEYTLNPTNKFRTPYQFINN